MSTPRRGDAPPWHPEVISPELVLVDPALAVRAREWLVDPEPILARRERLSPDSPLPSSSTHVNGESASFLDDAATAAYRRLAARALPAQVAAEPLAPPSRRPLRLAAVIAASCAALSVAVLLVNLRLAAEVPTTAKSAALAEPSGTTQAGSSLLERGPGGPQTPQPDTTSAGRRGESTAPADSRPRVTPHPRRFAWAPTESASAYHVELFRGTSRVFAADVTRPQITIPAKWTFDGRAYRLQAVEYRWYVWPIVSGRRAAKAVVQARLVVRDR